jgi:N-acetylneuraminate synthase
MFKKVYIIAEIGSSHDGSFGNACNMIIEASKSGADAVKFQTHIAEEETLENSPNPPYFKSESRFSYFKRTSFSFIQLKKLKLIAKKCKIDFLSSSFSIKALKILEKLDIKFHKVPSGELSNTPLLERIAKTKKIVFLSTGMSNWSEIDQAVKVFQDKKKLILMQCTSLYPCPLRYAGINLIKKMRNRYNLTIGFSDHTLGSTASVAAVLKGVKVIEKHFTLSNKMYGSDAAHSLNPDEFKRFSNQRIN